MKATIERKPLLELWGKVKLGVARRATLPILEHVLFTVSGNELVMAATNLELAISGSVAAADTEPGAVAVPVKQIDSFLRAAKHDVAISSQDTMLRSGSSSIIVDEMSAEDFPEIPAPQGETAHILGPLDVALSRVVYAAYRQYDRPVLHGVYLNQDGNRLNLTAADGFRLATTSIAVAGSVPDSILPLESAIVLQKLSKGMVCVPVQAGEARATFRLGGIMLTTQLVQSTYPAYKTLIPEDGRFSVTASTTELLSAVKEVSGPKDVDRIVLSTKDGRLSLLGRDGSRTYTTASVPCSGNIRVCVDSRYLRELLNAVEEPETTLNAESPQSVIKCVSGSTTHLLMPMHIPELDKLIDGEEPVDGEET